MYYLICCLLFVFLISVTVFFSSGCFLYFLVPYSNFPCVYLFFFSSVSIIITNSSDSLPSTLFVSAFGLLCQRFSLSLSMETSPSVFPFVSAFLILSESIIYYSLEGVFL